MLFFKVILKKKSICSYHLVLPAKGGLLDAAGYSNLFMDSNKLQDNGT